MSDRCSSCQVLGAIGAAIFLVLGPKAAIAQEDLMLARPPAKSSTLVLPQAPMSNQASAPRVENRPSLSAPGPQASAPQIPPSNSTRVIPVIPPEQDVLVLPQASTDFLGKWGGQLQLVHKYGPADPPRTSPVSFTFGNRDGQVVLATTVFGAPDTQILKTTANAEGPRKVLLEIKGLDLSQRPAIRHVEKLTLELKGNDRVRCVKMVDLYVAGSADPAVEAEYEGSLSVLTPSEDRMIGEEVLRRGMVPRARIDEGNPNGTE